MFKISIEQIAEIVDQHQIGFWCYLHKETGRLLFVPDRDKYLDDELEAFEEELLELENCFDAYIKIEGPNSRESFDIMESFAEQLDDSHAMKKKLFNALNKNKPFREFKHIIENDFDYRQEWFTFRTEKLKQLVVEKLEAINEIDEK